MKMKETFINQTKGYRFGDNDWYEPYTDNVGKLFRSLQKEYGRCVSKVYRDTKDKTITCGWVFEKRMKYEDARGNDPDRDYYTREVWVEIAKDAEVIPAKFVYKQEEKPTYVHKKFLDREVNG